jgi:hypothetical protein
VLAAFHADGWQLRREFWLGLGAVPSVNSVSELRVPCDQKNLAKKCEGGLVVRDLRRYKLGAGTTLAFLDSLNEFSGRVDHCL